MRGVAGVLSLAVALSGCTTQAEDDAEGQAAVPEQMPTTPEMPEGGWPFDESATADVDRETSRIVFPITRFQYSDEERAIVESAGSLQYYLCLQDEGVAVSGWQPREAWPMDVHERRFGVWIEEFAEQYAFTVPDPPPPPVEPWYDVTGDVADACHQQVQEDPRWESEFDRPYAGPLAYDMTAATDQVFVSEPGAAAQADWEACIEEAGLARDTTMDSPSAIVGATDEINEEQIRLALTSVRCKDEVNYVERLADVEAGFQQPVVDKYLKELSAERAELDRVLTEAREYLALHTPEVSS